MPQPTAIDAHFIQQHDAFLRRLACGLVSDGVEDVVQETWLGALQSAADHPHLRSPRSFLAAILRRGAVRIRGRERARGAVELAAAQGERLEDLVSRRLALQEELARALRELPDAQRTALYLRFHEDLTPSEIAARTGEPVATVKTRLARGLATLRHDLEARTDGDGRSWLAALVALASPPPRTFSVLATSASVAVAVGVAAVALLVFGSPFSRSSTSASSQPAATASALQPTLANAISATSEVAPPRTRTAALSVPATSQQSSATAILGTSEVTFELYDATGAPIPGAGARFTNEARRTDEPFETFGYVIDPRPFPVTAVTDAAGRATVSLPVHPLVDWSLSVHGATYSRVLHALEQLEPGLALDLGRLVAEPSSRLVVTLLGPQGSPPPPELSVRVQLEELAEVGASSITLRELQPLAGGVGVFEGLPAGRYTVGLHSTRVYSQTSLTCTSASASYVQWHPVVIAAGEVTEIVLTLDAAPDLELVAASAGGKFGARVPVDALRLSTPGGSVLSALPRTGQVAAETWRVPGEGPFVLEFDAPGWRAVRRDDVTRGERVALEVEPTSGVRLFIRDGGGAPILSGVRIGRRRNIGVDAPGGPFQRLVPMHLHKTPLAQGEFFPLVPGTERLRIEGPWWKLVEVDIDALTLDEVRDVHVVLEPARRIRGRVVDDLGAVVPFARVQLLERATSNDGPVSTVALPRSSNFDRPEVRRERGFQYADAEGHFELGCEVAGALIVRAWMPDAVEPARQTSNASWDARSMTTFRLRGTDRDVPMDEGVDGDVFETTLVLEPRVTVAGRITPWSPMTGGFDLALVPSVIGGQARFQETETAVACTPDAAGRFEFVRVAPGNYELRARIGSQPWQDATITRAAPLLAEFDVPVTGLMDLEVSSFAPLPELVPVLIESIGELHGPLVIEAGQIDLFGNVDGTTWRRIRVRPGQSTALPLEAVGRWRVTAHDERDYWSLSQVVDRGAPIDRISFEFDLVLGRLRLVDALGAPMDKVWLVPRPEGNRGYYRLSPVRRSDTEGVLELCLPRGPVDLVTSTSHSWTPVPGGDLTWPPLPGTTLVVAGN
jgi:RNA polymerase sigma factor (sigma-70 family)